MKKLRFNYIIYILFAAFYIWLAAQIPYTHDDWDWGHEIGMQQWLTASVNSRYVGNFFEIIMTRSALLKTVIMGGTFFLLPYLLTTIAASKEDSQNHKVLLFLAANFLILTMSRFIWSETYGWVAGFSNFGLSSVFMLLCINQWLPLCDKVYTPINHNAITALLWGIMAFMGQLFIENLSIIMAALSVIACVVSYVRTKKIPKHYIFMCMGILLGLCIMFSSSVYANLFGMGEAIDGYRQILLNTEGGFAAKLYNIFVQAARLATRAGEANFALCISVLALLTHKLINLEARKKVHNFFIATNLLFSIYFIVNFLLQTDYTPDRVLLSAFAATVNGMYFIVVAIEALIIYKQQVSMQAKLVTVWLTGVALLAPLVITSEAGYRLMFTLNVMVILFALYILSDILHQIHIPKGMKVACLAVTLVPVIVCIIVYSAIGSCNRVRLELMEMVAFNNAETCTLPTYPYANYLHAPDPIDESRMSFFKEFYGIDSNVTVIIEPTE